MEVIKIENEAFSMLIEKMDELISKMDSRYLVEDSEKETSEVEILKLSGERFYSSKEVCKLLKISCRTLSNYREKFFLPYICLGKKYLYKSTDIEKLVKKGYLTPDKL